MMRATTMQPPRDIPLLYPACPSCGRALRFARTIPGTQRSRRTPDFQLPGMQPLDHGISRRASLVE